jgi:hypothetical protein
LDQHRVWANGPHEVSIKAGAAEVGKIGLAGRVEDNDAMHMAGSRQRASPRQQPRRRFPPATAIDKHRGEWHAGDGGLCDEIIGGRQGRFLHRPPHALQRQA